MTGWTEEMRRSSSFTFSQTRRTPGLFPGSPTAQFLSASASEDAAIAFGEKPEKEKGPDIQRMQAKIGQLTLENDFLENALTKAGLLSAKR
jgi:hypothetical protein